MSRWCSQSMRTDRLARIDGAGAGRKPCPKFRFQATCGGAGKERDGSPGTPKGQYTSTVTGRSGQPAHSPNVTLTCSKRNDSEIQRRWTIFPICFADKGRSDEKPILAGSFRIVHGACHIRPGDGGAQHCSLAIEVEVLPTLSAQIATPSFTSVTRSASAPAGYGFIRHHVGGVSARSARPRSNVRDPACAT